MGIPSHCTVSQSNYPVHHAPNSNLMLYACVACGLRACVPMHKNLLLAVQVTCTMSVTVTCPEAAA